MSEAIKRLAEMDPRNIDTEAVRALAREVAYTSEYGYGPCDGALEDWIAAGDYDGTETVESIAREWDSDR